MKTLTVASIFSNFDFYQRNYLNILNQPESYYTPVEDAWIDAFPWLCCTNLSVKAFSAI
ncbi:hypothetical protein ACLDXR_10580 [Acinetobacter baumannii]|uniref:hypothetical protein n=1 Tax=Acinetobacter baumannii TaxID=470 RepID=UPI0016600DA6|nr:hypothetical protein [Acinetobacter baumannii]MCG9241134.1 hypothetical protein [Acinetobacter baumannii]MCZ3066013.1 hypothetical protein [Acinetobacter baumannii]MDV4319529.1 hypothetical protein [Acinetobacter baumannii]MDY7411102.1 hypothetical protein [Acinetobacter baumannii]